MDAFPAKQEAPAIQRMELGPHQVLVDLQQIYLVGVEMVEHEGLDLVLVE